jgi:hypothetical protein
MNKKQSTNLSSGDRELLALINRRYELAEKLIGSEPAIYYQFGLPLPDDTNPPVPVMSHRMELFNKATSVTLKKV